MITNVAEDLTVTNNHGSESHIESFGPLRQLLACVSLPWQEKNEC